MLLATWADLASYFQHSTAGGTQNQWWRMQEAEYGDCLCEVLLTFVVTLVVATLSPVVRRQPQGQNGAFLKSDRALIPSENSQRTSYSFAHQKCGNESAPITCQVVT